MKRAKIALTAIAIFAVIGGAYALKATRSAHFLFFETTNPGQCDFKKTGFTLADGDLAGNAKVVAGAAAPCPASPINYNFSN